MFQSKPQSRVNIHLELNQEGAKQRKELPLKLLVLANLTGYLPKTPLAQRERLAVTKASLNDVMRQLKPRLTLRVPHSIASKKALNHSLIFESLEDFDPERVVSQVPALQRLLAMRYLLNDLKSQLVDDAAVANAIKCLLGDAEKVQQIKTRIGLYYDV